MNYIDTRRFGPPRLLRSPGWAVPSGTRQAQCRPRRSWRVFSGGGSFRVERSIFRYDVYAFVRNCGEAAARTVLAVTCALGSRAAKSLKLALACNISPLVAANVYSDGIKSRVFRPPAAAEIRSGTIHLADNLVSKFLPRGPGASATPVETAVFVRTVVTFSGIGAEKCISNFSQFGVTDASGRGYR